MAIAGAAYLIDSIGPRLFPTYTVELASYLFVGEVALMVWLLVWAARTSRKARSDGSQRRLVTSGG